MEKPVVFPNRNGCRLFGMLYLPEPQLAKRIGIVISVNAIKYRVGTFRLHVLLARKFCSLGYTVLSFDPEGIGDSEGEFEHKPLSEHYFDIQMGKYTRDLADAVAYFKLEGAIESLLLCGLCGGAISVLMEAGTDSQVDGLILLNIPILIEDLARQPQAANAAKITSAEAATVLLKGKLQRFGDLHFWRRLLLLQVDLREEGRLVRRAIAVLARKMWRSARDPAPAGAIVELSKPVSAHRLFNMHFQRAFAQVMAARKHVLFMFAELDPWTWIFKSEFQDLALRPGNRFEKNYMIELIGAANHIFSARESQQQLQEHIIGWLNAHYPAVRRAAECDQ